MGTRRAIVGVDVGTTSAKALLVDSDGVLLAAAKSARITTRRPLEGHVEQDPKEIWGAVVEAVRGAVERGGGDYSIEGVAVASQSGSVARIDSGGQSVGPVATWMDSRADLVIEGWKRGGEAARIRSITGWTPEAGLGLLASFRLKPLEPRHRWRGALMVGGVDSLVNWKLTGLWTTNPSNAAGLQLLDLASGTWSEEVAAIAGVDLSTLPRLQEPGGPIGRVESAAAEATGLAAGVPVFAGGHDQACTALAVGVREPGELLLAGGTAWVLTTAADNSAVPLAGGVNVSRHVIPQRWTRSRLLGDFGAQLQLTTERPDRLFSAGDGTLPVAPDMADPFFVNGTFVDGTGQVIEPNAEQRSIAVMEAAALVLAEAVAGDDSGESITAVGGVTSGRTWPQLLADVTGRALICGVSPSWPAKGAALLAGGGAGLFEPVTMATRSAGQDLSAPLDPRPDRFDDYGRRAGVFRRLREESPR
jgi:sugar (pentulose or hexulose) kinase